MSRRRHVLSAVSVSTVCIVPAFLTGANGVQLGREFGIGADDLGLWIAVFFLSSAISSPAMGRLAETWGAAKGLRRASGLAALALLTSAVAPERSLYLGAMALGGVANALAHPSANLSLSRAIPSGRMGLAFGVKQSAVPAATLLSGIAVPAIALIVGWRWSFATGAVVAVVVMLAVPDDGVRADATGGGVSGSRMAPFPLGAFTVAGALGGCAAVSLAAFAVPAGVALGVDEGQAALLFALESGSGLLVRVLLGWAVDRARLATPSARYRSSSPRVPSVLGSSLRAAPVPSLSA